MRLPPTLTAWLLAGIALLAVITLGPRPEVNPENIAFIEQGQAVLRGETPMFFHVRGETWLPPIPVYANAMLQAAIGPIRSGQVAGAIAGAINIALVFLIAHIITGRTTAAIAAAAALMLTSGHTALALNGTAAIFPSTFILLWLYALLIFLKNDRPEALVGAAFNLGLCIYAHPAGPLTAAFLWLLTIAVTWRRNRVRLSAATLVFAAMWLPAGGWFYLHPNSYADTFGRWLLLKPDVLMYSGFWNPSWLFFGSGAPMFWIEGVLILIAVFCIFRIPRGAALATIGAALIVPVAGSTFGLTHYLAYAAGVLPLLAILAALGVDQLVGLVVRRQPLADGAPMAPDEGWHHDDAVPRR